MVTMDEVVDLTVDSSNSEDEGKDNEYLQLSAVSSNSLLGNNNFSDSSENSLASELENSSASELDSDIDERCAVSVLYLLDAMH